MVLRVVSRVQPKKALKNSELVKQLYDYAKQSASSNRAAHVPDQLVVEHMDEEQIWQQLELQNELLLSRCLKLSGKILAGKDETFRLNYHVAGDEQEAEEDEEDDDEDDLDDEEGEEEESELDSDEDDDEDDNEDEDATDDDKKPSGRKTGRTSIVDDQFFKLSEMEEFLEAEDRKEMQKNSGRKSTDDADDGIDYFKDSAGESADEDAETNYNYADFFGDAAPTKAGRRRRAAREEEVLDERDQIRKMVEEKNRKKLKAKREDLGLEDSDIDEEEDAEEEEDEEEEGDEEDDGDQSGKVKFDLSKNKYRSDSDRSDGEDDDDDADRTKPRPVAADGDDDDDDTAERSTHEHRQERLRLRIQDMEDQAMGEKSWQLRGEINSENRPQNSLLEEILEFDSTVRPAPVITEETTLRLEDIIRQRIKDKAWNDVERKFKPANTPQEFRKKLVLDQEKSKESLAQIYEKEYLKEVDKLAPASAGDDKEAAAEPKEHTEIRTLMKDLFGKLDALANFYYTPKVAHADVRIITNTPAINMEEVAPVAVSDAALLAPEEVRPRERGAAVGKSERTRTDKNRERRQKKQKQREDGRAKEQRDAERAARGVVSSSAADKKKLLAKVSKGRNVLKVCLEFLRGFREFDVF